MPATKRGEGRAIKFLQNNLAYQGDDCLIWPYCRNPGTGYGMLGHLGKMLYAHRFMCELAHGPAPSPKHYATHSCGMGHEGCVNPRHLKWDTPTGNAMDRLAHGNNNKPGRKRNKLTKTQVDEIRAWKGHISQYLLAPIYGVSRETISSIHTGRGHAKIGVR